MSEISHSDELVTKAELGNFYQRILPYLGGMPEMLANKFSKGDLYSSDEKMIGQWIDGKPLYQKTVLANIATTADAERQTITDISNVEKIVSYDFETTLKDSTTFNGVVVSTTNSIPRVSRIRANIVNGVIYLYHLLNIAEWFTNVANIYVTLRYTKTTDSAINIGSDTDYSTTEKVVGRWVDGKPLYQKTINCGALPNTDTKSIPHNISNVDLAWVTSGVAYASDKSETVTLPNVNPASVTYNIHANATRSDVIITTGTDRSRFNNSYVTIQYTKTTD